MSRGPISARPKPLRGGTCVSPMPSGISGSFPPLSQTPRQVTHVLLTRSPLEAGNLSPKTSKRLLPVRLAFIRHAASVRPEPGSNSPLENVYPDSGACPEPGGKALDSRPDFLTQTRYSVVKDRLVYVSLRRRTIALDPAPVKTPFSGPFRRALPDHPSPPLRPATSSIPQAARRKTRWVIPGKGDACQGAFRALSAVVSVAARGGLPTPPRFVGVGRSEGPHRAGPQPARRCRRGAGVLGRVCCRSGAGHS